MLCIWLLHLIVYTIYNFNYFYTLAKKHGLEEVSPEVINLISHASQNRLKNLIEKLSVISEHRLENPKVSTFIFTTSLKELLLHINHC